MRLLILVNVCVFVTAFAGLTPSEHLQTEMRAVQEGWHYDPNHPDYATGLVYDPNAPKEFSYESLVDADVEVPDELDYRDKSGVIRNQGQCGSCWAFSIVAMLTDALKIKGLQNVAPLSEQYVVDCARDMYGCQGGMPSAAKWVTAPNSVPALSDYPYQARQGRCQSKPGIGQALEWHYVGQEGHMPQPEEIMKALVMYGPVSVTIAADNALSGYRSGIFRGNNRRINHMVDINGYNKKEKYWIMRNSWGEGFGMKGWAYVAFGANAIATDTIFVRVKEEPPIPVIREFGMDSKNLTIKVTLFPSNKTKADDDKIVLQSFLKDLDRR